MATTKSNKAFDRKSLSIWSEVIDYHERQAKFWFSFRHTCRWVPIDPSGGAASEATPEEGYNYCRTRFNLERRQVLVNRRRLTRSVKTYLKNYKGK